MMGKLCGRLALCYMLGNAHWMKLAVQKKNGNFFVPHNQGRKNSMISGEVAKKYSN